MKHLSEERIQQTEKLIREIMKESDACGLAACIIPSFHNSLDITFIGCYTCAKYNTVNR